jgi:3-deoxy-manno-octulosonate cytidylyltransferase (CMP-KDO synthetase)
MAENAANGPNDFVVCIPARYASSRLPGKPLIEMAGKPLIAWALDSAARLNARDCVVATDDARIATVVQALGHRVVMTRNNHESGTDRLAEAAVLCGWDDDTIVLNYQGDEPLVPAANLQAVVEALRKHPSASMATLYQPIKDPQWLFDPNVVKVVTDDHDRALYFSRAPIPWNRAAWGEGETAKKLESGIANGAHKHHIGLYAYRVGFLKRFALAPVGELERLESLEQLRALQMGETIIAVKAPEPMPHGIDTREDLVRFEEYIKNREH